MQRTFNYQLFQSIKFPAINGLYIQLQQFRQFQFNISTYGGNLSQQVNLVIYASNAELPLLKSIFVNFLRSKSLKVLCLPHINLNDQSIELIKQAQLKSIVQAGFANNAIGHAGSNHLIECQWTQLKILYLDNNPIKNKGLQYLAKAQWARLQIISLQHISITDDGIRCLSKANWPLLKTLMLQGNNLTNCSLKTMITSSFSGLKGLVFDSNPSSHKEDTFFNHNLAAKYVPTWKQTYIMAKYPFSSSYFQGIIEHKNVHLAAENMQIQEDDLYQLQ